MTVSAASPPGAPAIDNSGWIESGLFILFLSLLNISYAFGQQWGVHPIAFIVEAMLVSALALIACGRMPARARGIVVAPQTWLFGTVTIVTEMTFYLLFAYVSPGEAAVLTRMSTPFSLFAGWLLYSRRVGLLRHLGAGCVVAAVGILAALQQPAHIWPVLLLTCASAALITARNFSAEMHPWNRRARSVREKMAVTGLVVLVTGSMMLALVLLLMGLVAGEHLATLALVPTWDQMVQPQTLGLALFMGLVVITGMQYTMFSGSVKIGAQNFVVMLAFTPLVTLAMHWALKRTGFLASDLGPPEVLPLTGLIIVGTGIILLGVRRTMRRAG